MLRPLVFVLALMLSATGAWADRYEDCDQSKDPDRSIRGCTQIIEGGKRESRKRRAAAYYNRGNAYYDKAEYDHAIADFDEAMALNPMYAEAYYNRAAAYAKKGDYDHAIADFDKDLGSGHVLRR